MSSATRYRLSNRGFTLIELLTVIAIIGVIFATAMLRVTGLTHRARSEWGIEQVINLDAAIRNYARNHARPSKLEFDLGTADLRRSFGDASAGTKDVSLGSGLTVGRFVSQNRDAIAGKVTVNYSADGISPTFAIQLRFTGKTKVPVWLLFTGTTGRVIRSENEREIISLAKAISPSGSNAR